jgi:hypothetical protein
MDGDQISFRCHPTHPHHWMVTEFLVAKKDVSLCCQFWNKNKNSTFAFLVRQSNTFNCHPMVWVWWMMTEFLWSPSNGGVMSDGNQIFFDHHPTHPHLSNGNQSFLVAKKRGHVIWFWKALNKGCPKKMSRVFQKHITCPCFLVTERIRLPSDNGNLSIFFNRHPTHPHYRMATEALCCLGGKTGHEFIFFQNGSTSPPFSVAM